MRGLIVGIVKMIIAMKTRTMSQILLILTLMNIMLSYCVPVCGPNQFFDVDAHMCDFCDMICDHPELQDTLVKCHTYCPAFLPTKKPVTTLTTGTPSHVVATTTSAPPPRVHLHGAHVVLIALGTSIVVVAALGILGIAYGDKLWKMVKKLIPRNNVYDEAVKYPIQEVGARNNDATNVFPVPNDPLIPSVAVAD
ncbi:uncharacterized protein [Haliotis cracherodii]|uniref:uncharacterized protein n=1 Tax=Haliotis cracherodii TaxID=6455 RepID=UPI0039E9653A